MIVTLDLAPAVALKNSVSRAAFSAALMIYFEILVVFVLFQEQHLSCAIVAPIAAICTAQVVLVRRPAISLVSGRFIPAYSYFLVLAAAYIVLLRIGARDGDSQIVAPVLGSVAVVLTSWAPLIAINSAKKSRSRLSSISSPELLLACLSFEVRGTAARRLRSFGMHRLRPAAPWLLSALLLICSAIVLAVLEDRLGFRVGPIIRTGLFILPWIVYRAMRHLKVRASELRERDPRLPVLMLREFKDDRLMMERFNLAPRLSFERLCAAELDRIGPVTSVGRPGERLAPLGASRDYLEGREWKPEVTVLIGGAGAVVFLLGDSKHLLWEFATAVATRGAERTVIIIPPFRKRAELDRRWTRFVETAEALAVRLPHRLPERPALAVLLAGDDAILMVSRKRNRQDYRFALRLMTCILEDQPASAREIECMVRERLPIVSVCRE